LNRAPFRAGLTQQCWKVATGRGGGLEGGEEPIQVEVEDRATAMGERRLADRIEGEQPVKFRIYGG